MLCRLGFGLAYACRSSSLPLLCITTASWRFSAVHSKGVYIPPRPPTYRTNLWNAFAFFEIPSGLFFDER